MRQLAALAIGAVLGTGCAVAENAGACGEEACFVPDSREALHEALEGKGDAVAAYFRDVAAPDGTVGTDWSEILEGVAQHLSCDSADARSFVVLSNLGLAPKGIVTHCSDDPVAASRFFAVFEPNDARTDLDPDRFRLVGWDAPTSTYRRYQMVPQGDALGVSVEPAFCTSCHGGPFGVQAWVPIMNEMTNPWAQWHAEPSFRSLAFDEAFDATQTGEVFEALADPTLLDSASRLEPVVRAAIDRVTAARIAQRAGAPELEVALDLLRPVFCDESLNYVSEVHRSGELRAAALVDPGLRGMVQTVAAGDWSWLHDDTLHLPPPTADEPALVLVAVRGESTVQAERALVSRQVLTPMHVLRVRALDWSRPVGSTLRCRLYEEGRARLERDDRFDVGDHEDNAELVPVVYEHLMQLATPQGLVSLQTGDDQTLVAIADAESPVAREDLAAGAVERHAMSVAELGDAIDAHLGTLLQATDARAQLDAERLRRACMARAQDPTAPLIEGAEDCR